jgi:hypothetical protein
MTRKRKVKSVLYLEKPLSLYLHVTKMVFRFFLKRNRLLMDFSGCGMMPYFSALPLPISRMSNSQQMKTMTSE